MNPKKCVFGVQLGKNFRYIVSQRGIKVDPAKVKAILEMPPPTNINQFRTLQGWLQLIDRFIAQLADKIHPFQHLLRKGIHFNWTQKCQEEFDQIKNYLLTPPVLMPPIDERHLILYVTATTSAMGALLAQNDNDGKERAIYYISCSLVRYELNYSPIEWACLAVVFVAHKLRYYMLNHKTKLIAKIDPLKYLLSKATLTGRLAKWDMILSEYDIEYVDCKAIKGQVIADQLADAPLKVDHPLIFDFLDESIFFIDMPTWKLYFDGSYIIHGSGAIILFITPQGDAIPKSFQIPFSCTNNMAKYEALLTGLWMAINWKIKDLQVYRDS